MAMDEDINTIKQLLLKMNAERTGPSKPQVMGSANLYYSASPPSNPVLQLNSSYYYDITLKLTGGTPADTNVYVQIVTEQTPNPSPMVLNSADDQWKIKGVRVNRVFVDPTTIGTAHCIVGYIGYDKPQNIELSV